MKPEEERMADVLAFERDMVTERRVHPSGLADTSFKDR